ncbi:MAG: methylmalonyl-CoA mutase [Deltaproteobacteria bacterium]|nr:methylmalonyl-CoA mutase [Deltaproteobacteria bacterium]
MTPFPPLPRTDWLKAVEATLKGAPFEKRLVSRLVEGIDLEPLYTEEDLPSPDPAGFAGRPPYTRGTAPTLPEGGWEIRQEYADGDVADVRRAVDADLALGARGFLVRLDAAGRAGRDWTPDLSGRDGASVVDVSDARVLLEGLDPEVAIAMDAGGATLPMAALLLAAAGDRSARMRGALHADPIAALAQDGSLPFSLDRSLAALADLAAWCAARAPGVRAVGVSTVPWHRAGATVVDELAIACATSVGYLRALLGAGLDPDTAARQFAFTFPVGRDLFLGIAALRAARRLWHRIATASGAGDDAARMVLHARTSPWTTTARDPWVNGLRATTEAFAAATAGADSIYTGPFDEALGPPDPLARRVACNTQVVLREEVHLPAVTDPAGGSYYVETLTARVAEAAWARFQALEARGGMPAVLLDGTLAAEVAEAAERRRRALATRAEAITGVSEYALLDEAMPDRRVASRPMAARPVANAAAGPGPKALALPPPDGRGTATAAAVAAAGRGSTLGALTAALAGDDPPARVPPLPAWRASEPYEALRDASDRHLAATGARPRLFLANLGPILDHKARAGFAVPFLAAGGIEAIENDGFATPQAAAEAFAASGAAGAVVCGTDAAYLEVVPVLAPLLKARGALLVAVAGRSRDAEAAWRAAGVDAFLFLGCDVVETLASFHRILGVRP